MEITFSGGLESILAEMEAFLWGESVATEPGSWTVERGEPATPAPKKAAPKKTAPAPEPEPEEAEETEETGATLEDAVKAATALVTSGKPNKVKAALTAVGVDKVSSLKGSEIQGFLDALEA